MTRQNYYAQRSRRARQEVNEDLIIKMVIEERRMHPRMGARKLHWILSDPLAKAGVRVGRDRFFVVLRGHALLVPPRRGERPRTTNSYHYLPVFINLVKDMVVSRPNQVWVADLTYLRTCEGFLFLALITDRMSRKIVGHHCGDTLEAIGCVRALEMALKGLPRGAKPIHHSDRGTQYCCHEYVELLRAHNLSISMTEKNHCAENAMAERMNGILKDEYRLDAEFETKGQAHQAVKQAVLLYNTRRPHTMLKNQIPSQVHSRRA